MVYRLSTIFKLISSSLILLVQISLWSSLIKSGVKNDITMEDMNVFIVINLFVSSLTNINIAVEIESGVREGSVALYLIKPLSFHLYWLYTSFGETAYRTLVGVFPVIIFSFFFTGISLPNQKIYLLFFFISLVLGMLIMFELTYVVGLLAFWVQRTWYLSWYLTAGTVFFGGTVVPIWFYPQFMKNISYVLPFRYISFESTNFYLEKTSIQNGPLILAISLIWFIILYFSGKSLWKIVRKKLMLNGG